MAYLGLLVLWLAILAALAAYAYRGWFSRYVADDYCTAGAQRAFGFLGAQVFWYATWSGRFTYYFVVGVVELAGPWIVQVLPAVALVAWLVVGTWAGLPIAQAHRWPVPLLSAGVLSGALILACLEGAPRLDQSLYWQTGMLTYLLPLVLLTAYAGWLVRRVGAPVSRRLSVVEVCASGGFLFVVGGISETSLSVQLALMGVAVVVAGGLRGPRHSGRLPLLLAAGLLATIVSAVVVVVAPGNYLHEARTTGSVHGLSQLPAAFQASVDFVGLFARAVQFRARPAVLILTVLSLSFGFRSAASGQASSADRGWYAELIAAIGAAAWGWLLLMAAIMPGYFAQAWDPPERAQLVAVWAAALALVGAGYWLGRLAARAARRMDWLPSLRQAGPVWAACLVLLAVGPASTVRDTLALAATDASFAAAWDALDATIRTRASAGQPVVVEGSLPTHFGFDFIGPNPGFYPNPCVAQLYAVPSIRSEE